MYGGRSAPFSNRLCKDRPLAEFGRCLKRAGEIAYELRFFGFREHIHPWKLIQQSPCCDVVREMNEDVTKGARRSNGSFGCGVGSVFTHEQ